MGKRVSMALGLALAIAAICAGTATAATTVANTNDAGPGSLRQALLDAPPGETISLPAGTYTLDSGPLVIAKPVTIAGHGSGDTVVRSVANTLVFDVEVGGALTLTDLSIRDMTLSSPSGVIQGGLIGNADAPLTLQRVVIAGVTIDVSGTSGNNGGVIQGGFILTSAPVAILDSSFVRNRVTANGGAGSNGGVVQGGLISVVGQTTMRNVAIDENSFEAKGGRGPSNPSQNGGVIQGGGALLGSNIDAPSVVENFSISANVSDVSGGAGSNGGVIQGGAIQAGFSKGSFAIKNSTIASNAASAVGTPGGLVQAAGLLLNVSASSTASIIDSTIFGNRAETAQPASGVANLRAGGPISIGNTIVAGGIGLPGKENCEFSPGVSSIGFNIDSADQCAFHGVGDKVNVDPQLGSLENTGGIGLSLTPGPASPAVDQGSRFGLATDQRGVVRPIDLPSIPNSSAPGADGSDIGAVELQPSNALALGKLKKNKKKGTATLIVTVPQPSVGTLVLEGKGLKTVTKAVSGEASFKFKVAATGKVKKKLRKKGKRKVAIKVTYTPTANTAATVTRKAKLVKKKAKHWKRRK